MSFIKNLIVKCMNNLLEYERSLSIGFSLFPSVWIASGTMYITREMNFSDLFVKNIFKILSIKKIVMRYYCSQALMLKPEEAMCGDNERISKQNIHECFLVICE